MPNIKDDSTVEAIAREFCSNGRNKAEAMLDVGYEPSYARGGRGQGMVYGNERVKAAIARIDSKTEARSEYDVDQCDKQYSEIITLAIKLKQPSAAVSAITGRARLRGWDKDTHVNEDTASAISPDQAQEYRRMAAAANRDKISISKEKTA